MSLAADKRENNFAFWPIMPIGEIVQDDDFSAAIERFNAGAQIAQVEASLIEHWWDAMRRIRAEKRHQVAIGLESFGGGNPDLVPRIPEQLTALMARCALLDALVEGGILDDYMENESLRKKVCRAAASLPYDKNDLGEALAQKALRESPPDVVEKTKEEMRQAGYDPDHPKVGDKFIEWMRDI